MNDRDSANPLHFRLGRASARFIKRYYGSPNRDPRDINWLIRDDGRVAVRNV